MDAADGPRHDSAHSELRLIQNAVDEERLLIVVGAGVSMSATNNAKESSWDGLLNLGLDIITDIEKRRILSELLVKQHDSKSAIYIAEAIEDALGGRSDFAFYQWLRETVGRLRPVHREVLEAIRDLHVPIATTNYDRLLEEIMARRPITLDDVEESLSYVRNENVNSTILHIHGYYENPQSVIFGTRSYYQLLARKGYAEAVLRALAIRYTWLFVGCGRGLEDPHFDDFISWMNRVLSNRIPWHYYLFSSQDEGRIRINGRIKPICYGEWGNLAPFLRSLRPTCGTIRITRPLEAARPPKRFAPIREHELRGFRKALLQDYPKPIAILGELGVGKTTFCLRGMHSPDVITRYSRLGDADPQTSDKWFNYVRLDATTSSMAMLQAIARSLGVQPRAALAGSLFFHHRRDFLAQILDALRKDRTILVLDGVDTPWHRDESDTERYLAKIWEGASASNSAIVAVITGYRRPLKLPWGIRIDLTPLSDEYSTQFFIAAANDVANGSANREHQLAALSASDILHSLITALDGIPLAIKVMASTAAIMVREKGGTHADWESVISTLRDEWTKERDSNCEKWKDFARNPLFSVWVSLRLVLPALETKTRRVFTLMEFFPDGMGDDIYYTVLDAKAAIDDLEKRALVVINDGRVYIDPTVRAFVRENRAFVRENIEGYIDHDINEIVKHYKAIAMKGEAIGWGSPIAKHPSSDEQPRGDTDIRAQLEAIKAEANNMEAIIRAELGSSAKAKHGSDTNVACRMHIAVRMALALGRFYRFSGISGDPKILEDAFDSSKVYSEDGDDWKALIADCCRVLGSIERLHFKFGKAETHYNEADTYYRRLDDDDRKMLGLAHSDRARGNICEHKGESGSQAMAVEHYTRALDNYKQVVVSLSSKANDTASGDDITTPLWQAKRGEAWCLAYVGDGKHKARNAQNSCAGEDAKSDYKRAEQIFQDIRDNIGYAHCQKGQGDICPRDDVNSPAESARKFYKEAEKLYGECGYEVGVADCRYSLGDEELRLAEKERKRHDVDAAKTHCGEAKRYYEAAKELYDEIGLLHGTANCLYSLGDVTLLEWLIHSSSVQRESYKTQAVNYYEDALQRYNKIDSTLGPANCHQGLGDVLLKERDREYNYAKEMLRKAFQCGDRAAPSFTFGDEWKRWRR